MTWGAKWVYVVALSVWLGQTIFFSFVVAPRVFGTMPVEEAGRVVGSIFPSYYRLGYACGVALLSSTLILWYGAGGFGRWALSTGVAAIMLAATLYAGIVIQPRTHALRPQIHDPAVPAAVKADFDRLHRRAVQLNGLVLIAGLVLTGITAAGLRN